MGDAQTTYDASLGEAFRVTITFDGLMGVLFVGILAIAVVQLFRLWILASKLSNRKRVYIFLILSIVVRMAWFLFQALEDNVVLGRLLPRPASILVSLYLYYAPMAMMYTACSYLILNWFQLYQKEKLRKKFRDRGRQQLPPIVKKQRSDARRNQLWLVHILLVGAIFGFVAVALPSLLLLGGTSMERWLQQFEIALASMCLLFLCLLSHMCFRRLGRTARARTSDSWKLKLHTVLTELVLAVLAIYFAAILLLHSVIWLSDASTSWLFPVTVVLRVYEGLFLLLAVVVLGFQALSLRAPLPTNTHSITQEWLTSVLQEAGILKSYTSVIGCFTQNLKGGCHFKVVRVLLKCATVAYDDDAPKKDSRPDTALLPSAGPKVPDAQQPHESLVVKLLYWNKPIPERIWTYIKFALKLHDPEVIYLRSYQVEHLFYKNFHLSRKLAGLKTPDIFFNLEDVFNNRFAMVQQDLSHLEDCQPNGFNASHAAVALRCLAKFHATNWHISRKKNPKLRKWAWNFAAFWTGERESDTSQIATSWTATVRNFPELDLSQFRNLGDKLFRESATIRTKFHKCCSVYRTLCHGDFKISNLFLDVPKVDEAQLVGASNYLLTMPRSGQYEIPPMGPGSGTMTDGPEASSGHVPSSSREASSLYAIDFQWFGFGNPCIDVAAFLCTSLRVENLQDHLPLLEAYHAELVSHGVDDYPFELFYSHFRLCVLEFGMYCIISKWSKMTEIDFALYAAKIKDGLHLRSKPHMMNILKHVAYFVETYEAEERPEGPLVPRGFRSSRKDVGGESGENGKDGDGGKANTSLGHAKRKQRRQAAKKGK